MEDPVLLDPALRAPTPESKYLSSEGKSLDLAGMVVMPTWREMLMELVKSRQMDPWDLDLVKITDAYLEQIKKLQAMDLRVPANVILAAALLLRFKADALQLEDVEEDPEFYEEPALIAEDIPELVFRPNRSRGRRMTLDELISAVEEVLKKGGGTPRLSIAAPRLLTLELPKMDMNERMVDVYQLSHSLKDAESILYFGQLLEQSLQRESHANLSITEAVSWHLLPILHLVQERKMLAWQDEFFGEVFLKVLTAEEQEAHRKAAEQNEDEEERVIMERAKVLADKGKLAAVKAKATRESKKAQAAAEAAQAVAAQEAAVVTQEPADVTQSTPESETNAKQAEADAKLDEDGFEDFHSSDAESGAKPDSQTPVAG